MSQSNSRNGEDWPTPLKVYIGLDRNFGAEAAAVTAASILNHTSTPVAIEFLDIDWLRRVGLYTRTRYTVDGQNYDSIDGKPFSTEFSFSRFLTPSLQSHNLALFVDGDFLFRKDIAELFNVSDGSKAVYCVKHLYEPDEEHKMLGQVQERYFRKNWSSLMLFDCDHEAAQALTPQLVNNMPGGWLHGFRWVDDANIGNLSPKWNFLEGTQRTCAYEPFAVHFTRGTPDMPGHEDAEFADEWREVAQQVTQYGR